ncbi:MAG: AI-2E family transporter [Actinobacteria bacterium]|nr:AI-2E family transporter [Actinomycetota bacterium]
MTVEDQDRPGNVPFTADQDHRGASGHAIGRFQRAARGVPVRTVLFIDIVVVTTVLVAFLAWRMRELILLVIVASFVALVLNPPVAFLSHHGFSRGLAVAVVIVGGIVVTSAVIGVLATPVADSAARFARELPSLVSQAEHGKGRIGGFVHRYHINQWVRDNAPKLEHAITSLSAPVLDAGARVVSGLVSVATIAVLSVFLLLEGANLRKGFLSLLPSSQGERVSAVAAEAARKVTGYMVGNLLTSLVAGIVVFVTLSLLGVPFAALLALWVALVDLLPLIGGLLAGVPTVGVAFLHSVLAGVVSIVVFVVYQEVENHLLAPVVMSRTVRISPLWVLVSVLVGADLGGLVGSYFGGLIGALVAIPAAGAIQVVVRELRSQPSEPVPTLGDHRAAPEDPAVVGLGRKSESGDTGPLGSKSGDTGGSVDTGSVDTGSVDTGSVDSRDPDDAESPSDGTAQPRSDSAGACSSVDRERPTGPSEAGKEEAPTIARA